MSNYTLQQLSPHVYWLPADATTDRPILGVVVGARSVLVIDAGNSPAHVHLLRTEMARQGLPDPTYVALTHWHWDHVFGTAALPLPTFASQETARIVTEMAHLDWSDAALDQRVAAGAEIAFCRDMIKAELPDRAQLVIRPPEIAFATAMTLDLGGITCELAHVGGDHAADSSIIYVREAQILFLGDCTYDDLYHGPRRLTTAKLFPLLTRLSAYPAAYYIAAHHDAPLTRAEFLTEASLLTRIGQAVTDLGPDRDALFAHLPQILSEPLTEDHCDIADAFLAGLGQ
ncbi:MAG: MBL fold metallo-hydrolase [Caldilineaceae bacterium]